VKNKKVKIIGKLGKIFYLTFEIRLRENTIKANQSSIIIFPFARYLSNIQKALCMCVYVRVCVCVCVLSIEIQL